MFKISNEHRQLILKYLSTRPYAEVFQLVALVVGLKPIENSKDKDKEKKEGDITEDYSMDFFDDSGAEEVETETEIDTEEDDINTNEFIVFAFYLYQLSLRTGYMINVSICHQCMNSMNRGWINIHNGDIVCKECLEINKNFIDFSFLIKLKSLHLDEINLLSFTKKTILDSIYLMELFLSYHIEGFNKIKSLKIVYNILNKELSS